MKRVLPPALLLCATLAGGQEWWRSALYPENWQPPAGQAFMDDAFLQDFSHAGYRAGEAPVPDIEGPVFDAAAHGADPDGLTDSTAAIQAAIDAASAAGGGVVYLGPGRYRVAPQGSAAQALLIGSGGVVLRGAGPDQTFILNTRTDMRQRAVIAVKSPANASWRTVVGASVALSADVPGPTARIPVADAAAFAPGEWVSIRADVTEAFVADLNMSDLWGAPERRAALMGPLFYRRITEVDAAGGALVVDAPVRFFLKTRDNARVHRTVEFLEEVGLEDFSIGNLQHPGSTGWGEESYSDPAQSAYDVHDSWLVRWDGARNGWMRSVQSFRAAENSKPVHMLSNGVRLANARHITLFDVEMQRPQYGGGGGNGYMIRFSSAQECLALDCRVRFNRHGFVFSGMQTSGNVIHGGLAQRTAWQAEGGSTAGRGCDHHMHLSQSNLVDSVTLDEDFFQAAWRGTWGTTPHGLTATHSVYWNLEGLRYLSGRGAIVESEQFAYGYVIGTRGAAPGVLLPQAQTARTNPVDWVEGAALGDTLWPQSLYLDQLARRLGEPPPGPPMVAIEAPANQLLPERLIPLSAEIIGEDESAPPAAFAWEQADGPHPALWTDAGQPETFAWVDAPGLYRFRVTVTRADWVTTREAVVRVLPEGGGYAELPAAAATFVRGGTHANTSYGATTQLEVKNDSPDYTRVALLRFDLAGLPGAVHAAELRMTSLSQGIPELGHVVQMTAADGWEEAGVTWNTRPAVLGLLGEVTARALEQWALDVAAAFDGGTAGRVAFTVAAPVNYGSQGWMQYAGRTHANEELRPRLLAYWGPEGLSYAEWILQFPEIPPELRGPDADAGGNGEPNLLAFFRGAHPLHAGPPQALTLRQEQEGLVLRWSRDPAAAGVRYRVEHSGSLHGPDAWTPWLGNYRVVDSGDNGALLMQADIGGAWASPAFFRLVVELEE